MDPAIDSVNPPLGVTRISTPSPQQADSQTEANMAAPAETPATQQNQLKNSI